MLRPTNEHIRKRAEELNVCSKWNRVSARSLSVVIARSPVVYPLCVSSDFPLEWQRSRHRTSRRAAFSFAAAHGSLATATVTGINAAMLLLRAITSSSCFLMCSLAFFRYALASRSETDPARFYRLLWHEVFHIFFA